MATKSKTSAVETTKKVVKKTGTIQVTPTNVPGAEDLHRNEKIEIRPFATETATVSIKYGFTKNMGDFESIRSDVMVSVPCYIEEIPEVLKQVDKIADNYIENIYKNLDSSSNSTEVKNKSEDTEQVVGTSEIPESALSDNNSVVDPGDISIEDLLGE